MARDRSLVATGRPSAAGAAERVVSDPGPIGVFDSGVGGLTVLREILRRSPATNPRSTSATTRAPRTASVPTRRSSRSRSRPRRARVARRQGDRRRLQHVDRGRAAATCGARYDLPILGVVRPGRVGGGARDPQPAGRRDRDAGDGPLARLLQRDQGREPRRRGLRARDAALRADGRGGRPRGPGGRGGRRGGRWRRSSASATAAASSSSRCRPSARDRHAAPRLHALPAAAAGHRGGRGGPGRDRRLGDRDRVGAGRAARGQRPRGARHDRGRRGPGAPARPRTWPAVHVQLTTGDVDALPRPSRRGCSARRSRTSSRSSSAAPVADGRRAGSR